MGKYKGKKVLPPESVKRTRSRKLYECDLCEDFVPAIVGLKIPDPTKLEEFPTSFYYVCPNCYSKFERLRSEIIEEAEEKKKRLLREKSKDEEKHERVMNIIARGRMTPETQQELLSYFKELAGED